MLKTLVLTLLVPWLAPALPTSVPLDEAALAGAASPIRSIVPGADRFTQELARRRALLTRHGGKDPRAILALTGVLGELGGEVDEAELPALIGPVARDLRRAPLVRSYAAYSLARLAEAAGDLGTARALLQAQGYLLQWQIIGPFDNVGRAGEQRADPPETQPFAMDAEMFGKLPQEPLNWRVWDYAALPRGGYVAFDDLLRPADEAVAYATCWVHVEQETKAALHLGTSGPYRVWVDQTLVGEGSAYRLPDPLQDTHPVMLRAGWNRLLLKVATLDNMWGFYARLSDPSGAALADLRQGADPPPSPPSPGDAPGLLAAHPVKSLRQELETRARASKADRQALVEFYRYTHPFDKSDRTAIELAHRVDEEVASGRSALLLAILDPDPNVSRAALIDGIARTEKDRRQSLLRGQLLLELAWRERALGQETRFDELLDQAARVAPGDPVVALARADRLAERGLPWSALTQDRLLAQAFPHSETVQRSYAARLRDLGRGRAALAVFEAVSRNKGGDPGVLGARIELLLELGEPEAAVVLARALADAMEGLPEAHAEVARLEEARGELGAAVAAMARATSLAPQDARLHGALGRLLARTGARPAAVASLRRSLELRPQQPQVRDLLASLDRSEAQDLLARYGVSLGDVGARPTPAGWAGAQAGVLHQRTAVKVLPNGLTERLDHRIIRIVDDRGVRSQAVQALSFDPAESAVEVRRARVRRADGTIEELGEQRMVGLASAGFRMYYDQRQLQVIFPGLRVGDTLEVAFVRRDIAARNMFDQYFGDMVPLSGGEPRAFVEYVLEAPADKPIYFNHKVPSVPGPEGRTVIYRYALRDVAAIKPEQGMPGWSEVAEFLHASTYRTWAEVGKWYWGLVAEQLVVDDAIRGAVAEILAGLGAEASERDKVAAIYAYVVRNTRYVGLEFGIHGYKPYRTTDVFQRRFGDCKDKASLLKVMLREAKIPSRLVLVRTRDQGQMTAMPASLAVFNHAITYVPSLDLFLDGTAEWAGPGELPAQDQGATVLIVEDGQGARLTTIPVSAAKDNVRRLEQTVQLAADGSAQVVQTLEMTGAQAAAVRYQFQSPGERVERLQNALGHVYAGVTVESVRAPELDDILKPARLQAELRVDHWAQAQGGGRQRFTALGQPSQRVGSMAPQDDRKYDLLVDTPQTEIYRVHYTLPKGKRLAQMPQPRHLEGPFGAFDLQISPTDGGVRVDARIELVRQRIPREQYPEFRRFLGQIDGGLGQSFTLEEDR